MTPEGKRIWNSPFEAHLMAVMLGEQPVTKRDELVIEDLVKSSKEDQPTTPISKDSI